jgi:hypothetical protein
MGDELQHRQPGRPCLVCHHGQRAEIEVQLIDGPGLTSVASDFTISRTSLRRHRDRHMSLPGWDVEGLSPVGTLQTLLEAAQRLGDIADESEARGRVGDATRALSAQSKTLGLLVQLGVRDGAHPLRDAAALERATAALILRDPSVGDQLAELLADDAPALAGSVGGYASRCRAYLQSISEKQEVSR